MLLNHDRSAPSRWPPLGTVLLSLAASVGLAGCGETKCEGKECVSPPPPRVIKAEAYCNKGGLDPVKRETFVILDEQAVEAASDGAEFNERNLWIRDAVLNLADPQKALERSSSAPRERITILMTSPGSSAAKVLFTGCIPGYSKTELETLQANASAASDFFGGGISQELEDDTETFRTALVGALVSAGRSKQGQASGKTSTMLSSLKASVGLLDADGDVARYVLVTGLNKSGMIEEAPSREKGIALGRSVPPVFAGGDVVVITKDTIDDASRSHLEGYFLGQGARLIYTGGQELGALPGAPAAVYRFAGNATYPDGPGVIQMRIAVDDSSKLVSSWIFLRHDEEQAVPIEGQAVCANGECTLRSSENGLGQVWSTKETTQPEFTPDLPFGGLRHIELTFNAETMKGRIYDPMVEQVGPSPENKDIPLAGKAAPDASF